MKGFIYVMQSIGWPENCFKVGFSKNPKTRVTQLATGNPHPIEIAHLQEVENMALAEKAIHQQLDFFGCRFANEFFHHDLSFLVITIEKVLLRLQHKITKPQITVPTPSRFIIIEQRTGLMNGVFGYEQAQYSAIKAEARYPRSKCKIFGDVTPYANDFAGIFPPNHLYAPARLNAFDVKQGAQQ
tara:strand:+ start:385 stop:939 length:555 start_codon:yes stop_codon:yes gene_type:complete